MSKVSFSKLPEGYSIREVDTYVDMLEKEILKGLELNDNNNKKIAQLEQRLEEMTKEVEGLLEDKKRFDAEISKAYEERDALKNSDERINRAEINTLGQDALIETILTLARTNECLVGGKSKAQHTPYQRSSQVDRIVDSVLKEDAPSYNPPKFTL